MPASLTAAEYVTRLGEHQSDDQLRKIQRYFKSGSGEYGEGDRFMGVRMGQVFELSKEFINLTPSEIETLLESQIHEVRAGGVSVMDKQGRRKSTPERRRRELYELYLRRMDRINNWDLVDLGAPFVIGRYVFDKPRDVLYRLAESENIWERRTAIVSTLYFVRQGSTDDILPIAEMLVNDSEDLMHKAVGMMLRCVGAIDRPALLSFLDKRATTMPRTMLRTATEHFDKDARTHYLSLKQARASG